MFGFYYPVHIFYVSMTGPAVNSVYDVHTVTEVNEIRKI